MNAAEGLPPPESSDPVGGVRKGKAPLVRHETHEPIVDESQVDEIEDVEMVDEEHRDDDEIVAFENETMIWEAMATQPVPVPRGSAQSAPKVAAPVEGDSAATLRKATSVLSTQNKKTSSTTLDEDDEDELVFVESPSQVKPSKPTAPSPLRPAPVPAPSVTASQQKTCVVKSRKSTFKSPLLVKKVSKRNRRAAPPVRDHQLTADLSLRSRRRVSPSPRCHALRRRHPDRDKNKTIGLAAARAADESRQPDRNE